MTCEIIENPIYKPLYYNINYNGCTLMEGWPRVHILPDLTVNILDSDQFIDLNPEFDFDNDEYDDKYDEYNNCNPNDMDNSKFKEPEPKISVKATRIFIGLCDFITEYTTFYGSEEDLEKVINNNKGHTILVETHKDSEGYYHYIHIMSRLTNFKTLNRIVNYVSKYGRNYVEYPYAIDEKGNMYWGEECWYTIIHNYDIKKYGDPTYYFCGEEHDLASFETSELFTYNDNPNKSILQERKEALENKIENIKSSGILDTQRLNIDNIKTLEPMINYLTKLKCDNIEEGVDVLLAQLLEKSTIIESIKIGHLNSVEGYIAFTKLFGTTKSIKNVDIDLYGSNLDEIKNLIKSLTYIDNVTLTGFDANYKYIKKSIDLLLRSYTGKICLRSCNTRDIINMIKEIGNLKCEVTLGAYGYISKEYANLNIKNFKIDGIFEPTELPPGVFILKEPMTVQQSPYTT